MTILVTGATGTIGRHVVAHLLEAGQEVRALTRNPAKANLPAAVELVQGDLTDPASFARALAGVTAIHMINFDGATMGMLETGPELVAHMSAAGVRRVTVLLGGEPGPLGDALAETAIEWTLLAPVAFMTNTLSWADAIRSEGIVREPMGDAPSPSIHEADIGAVAAALLVNGGHVGEMLWLTGPEVLTFRTMVAAIGEAIGRDLQFVELTKEEVHARWIAEGYSSEDIEFFDWVTFNTPEQATTVSPTVEQVTGRPGRTFRQWVSENVAAFR